MTMNKVIAGLVIILLPLLCGCLENESYPEPIIVSSVNGATYYPHQMIEIKWQVPDSTKTVEMQLLSSTDSHYFEDGNIHFDTLKQWTSFTNQTSYKFYFNLSDPIKTYFGFRLRYKARGGASGWTSVHYFNAFPYTNLIRKYITIKANFDFVTRETNSYYSDLITSSNVIDLDKELIAMGNDISRLEFVKLDSGYIKDNGNLPHHLERIVFGFNNVEKGSFPFDVWGEGYAIVYAPRITFSPFGGFYRNIYKEIGGRSVPMSAAYFLSPLHNKQDEIGIAHNVLIVIRLQCYFN
jgi:hypothetical protein